MKAVIISISLLLVTSVAMAQRAKRPQQVQTIRTEKSGKPAVSKKMAALATVRGKADGKTVRYLVTNPAKQVNAVWVSRPPVALHLPRKPAAADSMVLAVKGMLELPCVGCSVLEPYGNNRYGSYTLYNPGITFASPAPVAALASYDAVVENVVEIEGMRVVLASCKHLYFAYSNLEEVFVKKGDVLTAGKPLGTLAMNESGHYTLLFLLSVHEKEVNPAYWFTRPVPVGTE